MPPIFFKPYQKGFAKACTSASRTRGPAREKREREPAQAKTSDTECTRTLYVKSDGVTIRRAQNKLTTLAAQCDKKGAYINVCT
jgi:hypothetical protein